MATSDHDDILDQVLCKFIVLYLFNLFYSLATPVEEEKKDTQTLAEA